MMFRSKSKSEPDAPAHPATSAVSGAAEPSAAPPGAAPAAPEAVAAGRPAADGAPSQEETQRRAVSAIRQSLAFTQIVTVLMRSPRYRHYSLGDLEWLVIPPLATGQYSVAEVKPKHDRVQVPVGVALWASVSAEVDKKLSENLQTAIRLRPDEWKSGDILWLIDVVGDSRAVPQLLKQLVETSFKGRAAKMRTLGKDGKILVQRIAAKA
jgi:hemolysin-activating ACP:hemolysin acyltransferase